MGKHSGSGQAQRGRERFEAALARLVEQLQADPHVLAVILFGSLSHGQVWAKSDIDLVIVTDERGGKCSGLSLLQDGVIVHAQLMPRQTFVQGVQSGTEDSWLVSIMATGRVLFVRDESLRELVDGLGTLGARDRQLALLGTMCGLFPLLTKVEKWLYAERDVTYAAYWLLALVERLAHLEVLWAGQVPGREALRQARVCNEAFVVATYDELWAAPPTYERVAAVLDLALAQIQERRAALDPLIDYLREAPGALPARDIAHHFEKNLGVGLVELALEWLAGEQVVVAVPLPARLVPRSRATVDEVGYVWGGEGVGHA